MRGANDNEITERRCERMTSKETSNKAKEDNKIDVDHTEAREEERLNKNKKLQRHQPHSAISEV